MTGPGWDGMYGYNAALKEFTFREKSKFNKGTVEKLYVKKIYIFLKICDL